MMKGDMLATTPQKMSAQQRMRRLILLHDYLMGCSMTATEEMRGYQLQVACLKKNEEQCESNCWAAEEKRTPENMCLAVTEEERTPENVYLAVTEECKEKVTAVKVKALRCFGGYNNQIHTGGVCSKHGTKQMKTCSKESCTKQDQLRRVCVTHGAKIKLCSHEGCTKQVVSGREVQRSRWACRNV
jgi:hypothetical protein